MLRNKHTEGSRTNWGNQLQGRHTSAARISANTGNTWTNHWGEKITWTKNNFMPFWDKGL